MINANVNKATILNTDQVINIRGPGIWLYFRFFIKANSHRTSIYVQKEEHLHKDQQVLYHRR